jgi:hypothetical protein
MSKRKKFVHHGEFPRVGGHTDQRGNSSMTTLTRLCRFGLGLLFAVMGFASMTMGQTGTATLSGIVTDEGGGTVPNCEIQLQSVARGNITAVKTNSAGIYVFSAVQPGSYNLTIRRTGFKQVDFLNLLLNTQDHVEQNFRLQVGSISESVTVNANNEHMATDDPAVGLLVDRTFVENMPLNGRSFQDLIALAPGTVTDSTQGNDGLFSVNGQRGDANYFTVDGVAANTNAPLTATSGGGVRGYDPRGLAGVLPAQTALGTTQSLISVDALQEFKIQTSSYSAENGRQPGAQVQLTSRSGSNDIHGSAYDYLRNEAFDANSWFFNQSSPQIPRQRERQNDFGGTIGGPLRIPKLYNGKDKTFYFFSYEGLRLTLPTFVPGLVVPTVAFRQFASAAWQPLLNAEPLPNRPDNGDPCAASLNPGLTFPCTARWAGPLSNVSSVDSASFRIDQRIGERLQLFVRYSNTPSVATTFSVGDGNIQSVANSQNSYAWTTGGTLRLSDDTTDEMRVNWTNSSGHQLIGPTKFGGAVPYAINLLVPSQYAPTGSAASTSPVIVIPDPVFGTLFLGPPSYQDLRTNLRQLNLVNSLALVKGRHGIKIGADFRRLQSKVNIGQYTLNPEADSVSSVQNGIADTIALAAGQPGHPTFTNLSLFAEDTWKYTPRLTIDFGLRWELNPTPGKSDGSYPLAVTTANVATAQLAPAGTAQYRTAYYNFGPRIGFAYQGNSSPSHPFVVRGGFGIFYDTGQNLGATGYYGYPFTAVRFLTNVPLQPPANQLAPPDLNIPLVPPYGGFFGVLAYDPRLSLPYTESWNLSLSEGLGSKNTLTASYVGNAGKKLLFTQQYFNNGFDPIPQNPSFTFLQLTSNAASSNYHALQVQDQGYVLPGMELIASYTWAHAIDSGSADQPSAPPLRGNSDNDIRHIFNVAINYNIKEVDSKSFMRVATHGWSVYQRFTAQSGSPLTVCQSFFNFGFSTAECVRPDLVPGLPIVLRGAAANGPFGWALSPAAFSPVPLNPDGTPIHQGDLPRNHIHGPGFWNLTMGIQREFPIAERLKLLFRVDAFNLLNHPNATNPTNTCLCAGSGFGKIGSDGVSFTRSIGVPNPLYGTGQPRSLQLMLKAQF